MLVVVLIGFGCQFLNHRNQESKNGPWKRSSKQKDSRTQVLLWGSKKLEGVIHGERKGG